MQHRTDIAISSIHNVVVALNQGGMLSCDAIMMRCWNASSAQQQDRKRTAARNPRNHREAYALQQLRGEVRRSLYSHFNNPEIAGFDIYRATAHSDAERFWVAEEQVIVTEVDSVIASTVEPFVPAQEIPEVVQTAIEVGDLHVPVELPDNASLFDRLTAGTLQVTGEREHVTVHFPEDITQETGEAVLDAVREEFCNTENTPGTRTEIGRRVNQILNELGA